MADFRQQASTSTRISMIDPSSPGGWSKAYALGAGECLMCARWIDERQESLTGSYILVFHALELALKAFLVLHGKDKDCLSRQPYRHNLNELYKSACESGMNLSIQNLAETISWINEWHYSDAKIRYEFVEHRELPLSSTLFPVVEAVISASKTPKA